MLLTPELRHIAILNKSEGAVSNEAAERAVVACRRQLQEHLAPLYPGEAPWTCALYEEPPADTHVVLLLPDDGYESSRAHHWAAGGFLGGAVDCAGNPNWSASLSHELTEIACNPYITNWITLPDGSQIPRENADPVQEDRYKINGVWVSNFVTAAFWDKDSTNGPYDFMRTLSRPLTLGNGYWVRKRNGVRTLEWGAAVRSMSSMKFHGASRTFRLMSK